MAGGAREEWGGGSINDQKCWGWDCKLDRLLNPSSWLVLNSQVVLFSQPCAWTRAASVRSVKGFLRLYCAKRRAIAFGVGGLWASVCSPNETLAACQITRGQIKSPTSQYWSLSKPRVSTEGKSFRKKNKREVALIPLICVLNFMLWTEPISHQKVPHWGRNGTLLGRVLAHCPPSDPHR